MTSLAVGFYNKALQFQNEKFGQEGEIAKKRQELTGPMIKKVQEILEKIGKAENYDMIFDTVNGTIVFAKEEKFDKDFPPLLFEGDGTSDWATFVLTDAPADVKSVSGVSVQ